MTTTALHSPFEHTIDAILHYFPLTSPDRDETHNPRSETRSLSSSISSPHTYTRTQSPFCTSSSTSTSIVSALPLPTPYRPAQVDLPSSPHNNKSSPSRFTRDKTTLIEAPTPRRADTGTRTAALQISPSTYTPKFIMESSSLAVPRNSKGGGGSSPSRNTHHLNALSPLQSFSPLQTSPRPKTASVPSASAGSLTDSATGEGRTRLVRSMSRKQSMYASAAQWEKGQWERENENTPIGGLFSKITLVKAPDLDSGLKK